MRDVKCGTRQRGTRPVSPSMMIKIRKITKGSSRVSGGYKEEFAAIAFTESTYNEVAGAEEIPPQVSVTQEFKVILAN